MVFKNTRTSKETGKEDKNCASMAWKKEIEFMVIFFYVREFWSFYYNKQLLGGGSLQNKR